MQENSGMVTMNNAISMNNNNNNFVMKIINDNLKEMKKQQQQQQNIHHHEYSYTFMGVAGCREASHHNRSRDADPAVCSSCLLQRHNRS